MQLTNSQEQAMVAIDQWIKQGSTRAFSLSGRAGTGKTFLTKAIIQKLLKGKRVTVSAYTHKAVRVISQFTGMSGHTIHSLHGLRINYDLDDLDPNKVKFEATGTPKFDKYDYIIMDEASMIGGNILTLNERRCFQFNTRIIYVGDTLQLPPVVKGEERTDSDTGISPVFSLPDRFELTEIVRQATASPLIPLLEEVRLDIGDDGNRLLNYIHKKKESLVDGFGYYSTKMEDFQNIVSHFFTSKKFEKDINFVRIAGFTNAKVDAWNNYIRRGLFETEDILTMGDKLMGYQTVVDEYNQTLIVNSNDYIVRKVTPRLSDDGFREYVLVVKELSTNHSATVSIVDHKHESFENYKLKLQEIFRNALYAERKERGVKWREYFEYKTKHLTMIAFPLFEEGAKQRAFIKKDVGYAYAVTTHKLQGSTIENIMVDIEDIAYTAYGKPRQNSDRFPNMLEQRNRLLYTAISRASKKAILLVKYL